MYFDYLRLIATFGVIVLHISAQNWHLAEPGSVEWNAFNGYDSLVRWTVPIFVMISGALFLAPENPITMEKLFKKNILRMVTAYLFWAVIYAVVFSKKSIKAVILATLTGHHHLWFLVMLVGVYLLIPVLRKITEDTELTKYFLLLGLVFTFIIPYGLDLLVNFGGSGIVAIGNIGKGVFSNMKFHFTLGYPFYFVAGYYLSRMELSKKARNTIYVLGVAGFVLTMALTTALSVRRHEALNHYYDNFTVNVLLEALAVFTFGKYELSKISLSDKGRKVIGLLSKYSFGVYLVHVMIQDLLCMAGIDTLSMNPFVSVPLLSVVIGIISLGISYVLNKIPVLNRFIV